MDLAKLMYSVTEHFPRSEQFGLVTQLRRAAVSVPANLAEGAARHSVKEQLQFYFVSRASLSEIDTLIELSAELRFLNGPEHKAVTEKLAEASSLIQGLLTERQQRS